MLRRKFSKDIWISTENRSKNRPKIETNDIAKEG